MPDSSIYMPKIKILHIIKSLGRGGAEVLLPESLRLHNKIRFEFHYVYFLPWKDQMVNEIEEAGGTVKNFPANNNLQMLFKADEVIDYINHNNIHLIHCHLPWSGFLGRRIFSKTDIPVVYTEHNIQERYHPATKFVNKWTFNFQSLAIGVSNDVTRSILENISPDIPVQTVLNGVNTENFYRKPEEGRLLKKKLNIPEESVVIGNIAVFREQKALLDWVRAFDKINREEDVFGILVGAGPQDKEIRDLVEDLGLGNKIKMPGLQTNTLAFFSAMDVFMMSSLFEGLPIALLEAMSMSCAVVSTKAGGVVEVVEDRKNGLLCDTGDWEELSALSLQVVRDESMRKELQTAARERIIQKFSLMGMVKQLEEIYSKISSNDNQRS